MTGKLVLASEKVKSIDSTKLKTDLNSIVNGYFNVMNRTEFDQFHQNTLYLTDDFNIKLDINIISKVQISIDRKVPGMYNDLLYHLKLNDVTNDQYLPEFYQIGIINIINTGKDAIELKLNDHIIGYYLPELNNMIVGNWTWHKDYANIFVPAIWQSIVKELRLTPIEDHICPC
jgi:hypothetical protein